MAVDDHGWAQLLMAPQLGTDYRDRIGRKTVTKSIFIRGKVYIRVALGTNWPPSNTWIEASSNRIMLVIDWQPNHAPFTITDLLQTSATESQLNANNRRRFTIIKDELIDLDILHNNQMTTANRCIQSFKWYERVNIETIYNNNNTGTIADIDSGAIYLVCIGTTMYQSINPNIILNISSRIRYDDC